jgi:hypothetical protein
MAPNGTSIAKLFGVALGKKLALPLLAVRVAVYRFASRCCDLYGIDP